MATIDSVTVHLVGMQCDAGIFTSIVKGNLGRKKLGLEKHKTPLGREPIQGKSARNSDRI